MEYVYISDSGFTGERERVKSAEMKNKKLDIDKSKLEFVNVKNKGSKNLVIAYSQKDNCYYLFDEK